MAELALLLAVTYLPALAGSVLLLSGMDPYSHGPAAEQVRLFLGAVLEGAYVALLLYILFRQGRSVRDLGFSFRWRDIPVSWLILASAVVPAFIGGSIYFAVHHLSPPLHPGFLFKTPYGLGRETVWAVIIGSFAHQLIYRAYVISELEYLTGRKSIAVMVSVLLQVSYQLQYGFLFVIIRAVIYLVFSLYYVLFRRIMPVILADLYLALLSLMF